MRRYYTTKNWSCGPVNADFIAEHGMLTDKQIRADKELDLTGTFMQPDLTLEPGDYQVDLSSWEPTATSVASLMKRSEAISSEMSKWSYSFKDGKDDGRAVNPIMYKGLDPTEMQAYKDSLTADVKRDIQEAIDNAANDAIEQAAPAAAQPSPAQ